MATYLDIETGVTQDFDFDPSGGNPYSKFQLMENGKFANAQNVATAQARIGGSETLPIPPANNGTALGGAGSFPINSGGDQTAATSGMDIGAILAALAGISGQNQGQNGAPPQMVSQPLQGRSTFFTPPGQDNINIVIPPGSLGGGDRIFSMAGGGPYRGRIQAHLTALGYAPQEIQTILADFDASPQGQIEVGPQAQPTPMATGASQGLNDMLMGLLTGTQGAGAGNESMWSAFGSLFDTPALQAGAPASQAGAAPGGGFEDLFKGTFEASGLGGTGTGTDGGSQSFVDFLGGLDTGVGAGFGGLDLSEAGIEKMANTWVESQNIYGSGAVDVAKLFGQFMVNETDAQAQVDIKALTEGGGDLEQILEQMGLPGNYDALYDKDDPNYKELTAEERAELGSFLGETQYSILNALLTQASNERQFNEMKRQFNENLTIAKQDQRVSIFESMSNLTMERLKLNETSKTNLMSAQLAAMDTALKSKELSQAEAADIRQNMLDSVALELEAGRINQEQEQFLMRHFLDTEGLALQVRQLEEQGRSADADRELERYGMNLADNLGYAELAFGREQLGMERELGFASLGQERELGFASLAQRQQEANLQAQISLLTAAMQNPSAFAALRSMGGLAGGGAPAAAGTPTQMFPDLGNLGFQIPQTAGGGATTPAPAFFTGGMPTIGALGQLDPSSLAFLQNVLGFGGTTPEGLGQQAAAVTPAAGGFAGLGRTLFG